MKPVILCDLPAALCQVTVEELDLAEAVQKGIIANFTLV